MTTEINVEGIGKRFRIPVDRSTTLKYRITHPRSSHQYRDFWALRDVTFTIATGEFVGIIGPNGCGKSTLLKLLARIYNPTNGVLDIRGKVSPFLELGVGFNPELTARENVYLNGAILGLTRSQLHRKIDEIISFAGLEDFVDQKVKNFSSGMEVRLAFSVAIQADAGILLMDEVLAVGDAQFQAKCFEVFARYKREGRTVILVTHDLGAVDNHCDRALLLDHGTLIAQGSASEITSLYRRRVGNENDQDQRMTGSTETSSENSNRWGSGEVRISKVALCDASGAEHHTFTTNKPMNIRIETTCSASLNADVAIGLSLHRPDGYLLSGTNTVTSHVSLSRPKQGGTSSIEYRIDQLGLLAGTYRLSFDVYQHDSSHVFDHLDMVYDFNVVDESGRSGLFELGGRWIQ